MTATSGRGVAIPNADDRSDLRAGPRGDLENFERLERLVKALVGRYEALGARQAVLEETLAARDARIRSLEEQVLQLNQSRRDVAKRIDELVAVLDRLDGQLAARADAPAGAGGSE
jgi:septal ring factor EnvC (AmiA/AmiB activator)